MPPKKRAAELAFTPRPSPAELLARIAERRTQIEALFAFYEYSFPEFNIAERTLRGWLDLFDYDLIVETFEDNTNTVIMWADKGIEKSDEELVSYLSGTMHNKLAEQTGIPRKKKP
jgi:hypothetical protein